jgi:hypothetical protein
MTLIVEIELKGLLYEINQKLDTIQRDINDLKLAQSKINDEINAKKSISFDSKNLHWNPKAYDYLKEQEEIFDRHLSELVKAFAGRYVVFENGLVVDSDENENVLIDRICETEFYKQRPDAILLTFVPRLLPINA